MKQGLCSLELRAELQLRFHINIIKTHSFSCVTSANHKPKLCAAQDSNGQGSCPCGKHCLLGERDKNQANKCVIFNVISVSKKYWTTIQKS